MYSVSNVLYVCYLKAPIHYKKWFVSLSKVYPGIHLRAISRQAHVKLIWNVYVSEYTFEIITTSPRIQWVYKAMYIFDFK